MQAQTSVVRVDASFQGQLFIQNESQLLVLMVLIGTEEASKNSTEQCYFGLTNIWQSWQIK